MVYVNKQELRAIGTIVNLKVKEGTGVFLDEDGNQKPGEYQIEVDCEVVLRVDKPITVSQAKDIGYNLTYKVNFRKDETG